MVKYPIMKWCNPSNSANEYDNETWEKLLGSQNWDGLLHPLNLNLRKLILRCGDFCHSAYDAFAGVNETDYFHEVKLPEEYQYHSPLYAATNLNKLETVLQATKKKIFGSATVRDDRHHNPHWMGYSASTTDDHSRARGRREVYIVWRGTQRLFEWRNNLVVRHKNASCLLRRPDGAQEENPRVMKSWLGIYTSTERGELQRSAREQVKAEVGALMERYKGERISIVVTGHSLGGILAILTAFDIVENLVGEEVRVAAVLFGCPRVGNSAFRECVKKRPNLNVLHIKNKLDLVTRLPPARRVGTELVVNSRHSDELMLRDSNNLGRLHDLETCLHMVSGWDGPNGRFEKQVPRSNDRLIRDTEPFKYVRSEICKWFEGARDNSDSESSDDER